MQSEKVNYSVKYASASHPVSDTNLSASVCQWLPKFFVNSKAPSAQALFNLNTSSFTQDSAEKEFKRIALHRQSFVGIQEVISIILAQEKHKVSRNEVTEGTYRMTKVRLETHITAFFDHTDLRTVNMGSIQRFIDYLSDQELSTPTIVGYIAQLRKVLRYLVEHEHIAQMPLFPKMKVT